MSYFYSGATLQQGSQGADVSEWQKFLKSQGYYTGSIDGIFGPNTEAATKAYQTANGLGVDGIAGIKTFTKAGFKNYNQAIDAPTLPTMPTNPTYDYTSWDDTEKGKAAAGAYDTAKGAVDGYGPFNFSENEWLERVKGDIADYGDFSYNFNEDALYQQYKDKYIAQGKLAMADTMGQAAALTGGYGNSYAATAGNQAYQAHLQNLNDIIPDLYQMALQKYSMGKEALYNQYGMLLSEYEREYGLYSDEYNKLLDKLGIARDDYYSGADMHYTEQSNKNTALGNEFDDAMSIWGAESDSLWKETEWNESMRRDARDQAAKYSSPIYKDPTKPGDDTPKYSDDDDDDNVSEDDGYKAVNTKGVTDFKAGIRTRSEFHRGENADKIKYKTYEAYIEGKLDQYLTEGKLTEDEVATLIVYYGLV